MPLIAVNGQQIFAEDSGGDGPPVILAHGFLMDHEMFAAQVAALRGTYRVLTWDERGFGRTVYDGKPFSYWDSAADCIGLLDHFGIERAVVGGMSQGGFVSLRVALVAPERVRALVLLDTEAGVPAAERAAGEHGMSEMWLAVGPVDELAAGVADLIIGDQVAAVPWIAKWQAAPKESLREPAACLHGRDDITARLGEITCPALVVHGIDDAAIPMDRADALADGLVGCGGVVVVPGGHSACMTHPADVSSAIGAFLATLAH
jgi:pimeloyl-ACP methyl ester carboxylesterase